MFVSARQERRIRTHIAQQMVQKDIKSQQLASCTVTEESTVCPPSTCVELVTQTEDMPFEPVDADACEIVNLHEEEEICLSVSDEEEQLEQESESESDGYLSTCSNGTISDDVSSLSDPDDHYLLDVEDHDTRDIAQQEREALFPGALLSNEEFSAVLLSMFLKHNLPYKCASDLLKLLGYTLPSPNSLPRTQHMMMNKFIKYDELIVMHYCCSFCFQSLAPFAKCSRQECQSSGAGESSFFEVRVDKQIQCLFSGTDYNYHVHVHVRRVVSLACTCTSLSVIVHMPQCMPQKMERV